MSQDTTSLHNADGMIPAGITLEDETLKNRALDASPIGVTIADMSEEDEPLIYVNTGFERLTGYGAGEVIGDNCRFLQGPETADEPVQRLRTAIDAGDTVQVDMRNYRKDGSMFWNEVTLAPVMDGGNITHYVGFQQDITIQKEFEARLRKQREDLESLNKMVAHDLRNDLQIILMVLQEVDVEIPSELQSQIDTAVERTEGAISMTKTASDIAEAVVSVDDISERIRLDTLLEREIADIQASYPDAIVTSDDSIPEISVIADKMLPSVFRNLLKNAVIHNDSETVEIDVSTSIGESSVVVTISDNGPGFPEDAAAMLESGTTLGGPESTGIGLSLVKTLVDSYAGDISIKNDTTGGARVSVSLPIAE